MGRTLVAETRNAECTTRNMPGARGWGTAGRAFRLPHDAIGEKWRAHFATSVFSSSPAIAFSA